DENFLVRGENAQIARDERSPSLIELLDDEPATFGFFRRKPRAGAARRVGDNLLVGLLECRRERSPFDPLRRSRGRMKKKKSRLVGIDCAVRILVRRPVKRQVQVLRASVENVARHGGVSFGGRWARVRLLGGYG